MEFSVASKVELAKAAPAGEQPQSHFMQAAYRHARFVLVDNDPPGSQRRGAMARGFQRGGLMMATRSGTATERKS